MIVVMSHCATDGEIDAVLVWLKREGFQIHLSRGVERTIIGAIGDKTHLAGSSLEAMPSVERVVPILQPYKLASRTFQEKDTIVRIGGLELGGDTIHVIAGPCAVESREQLLQSSRIVRDAGATMLRGGAF